MCEDRYRKDRDYAANSPMTTAPMPEPTVLEQLEERRRVLVDNLTRTERAITLLRDNREIALALIVLNDAQVRSVVVGF